MGVHSRFPHLRATLDGMDTAQDASDPFMAELQRRADASNITPLRYLAIAEGETPLSEEAKTKLRDIASGIYYASLRYEAAHPTAAG
jgi:hypothetical protein